MTNKLKNVTFSLPENSIRDLKKIVEGGHAKSVNSVVREAIALYTSKIEKENLKKEMESASRDPLFLKDLQRSMDSFKTSDKETEKLITDW